jgi:hypothetical protein
LGLLALAQDRPDPARQAFQEGLTIAHQSNYMPYIVYNLIGMAYLWSCEQNPSNSCALLSAAAQLAERIGLKIEPELQEPYDKTLAECRRKVTEQEFKTSWHAGRNMEFEQAVNFALEN